MIEKTVYFTARCDCCNKAYTYSESGIESQVNRMERDEWWVDASTGSAVCPICMGILNKARWLPLPATLPVPKQSF